MAKEEGNIATESSTTEVKTEKTQYELQKDIDALEVIIATLKEQMRMPLSPGEVTFMKNVVSDEKIKLGAKETVLMGLSLIDKLYGYLNPELPFVEQSETSATTIPLDSEDDE